MKSRGKIRNTDWFQTSVRVGEQLSAGPWHLHHIFPDDTFDPDRGTLIAQLEQAQEDGDEDTIERIKRARQTLEAKVYSLGNLAFLMPGTNESIGKRAPTDYLKEIAQTEVGKKSLEAQMIPLEPELWKHKAFDAFCARRCELLAHKASEFFFTKTMHE